MKPRLKLFIILAVVFAVIIAAIMLIQGRRFHVVSSVPDATGTVPTSLNSFQVETNKDLAPDIDYMKQLEDPAQHVKSIKVDGKKLKITTAEHAVDKKYSFTIKNIRAKSGESIQAVKFNYTARYVAYEKLSKAEKAQLEEQKTSVLKADPILDHLPHSTLDYSLEAQFGDAEAGATSSFVLNAKLLLTNADVKIGEAQAVDSYKKEVTDYITSLGLKPESYIIQYQVVRPN